MAVSKVTVHFPCPVERVWHTVTDLTHTCLLDTSFTKGAEEIGKYLKETGKHHFKFPDTIGENQRIVRRNFKWYLQMNCVTNSALLH